MTLPKIQSPNFTQVPNVILDAWMPLLDPSLFKIVLYIARQTFGWSKMEVKKVKVSLAEIADATNLARRTVIDHIKIGLEMGALNREAIPGTNEYYYFIEVVSDTVPKIPDDECKSCTTPYAESALPSPKIIPTSAEFAPPPSAEFAPPPSDLYLYKESYINKPPLTPQGEGRAGALGLPLSEEEENAWQGYLDGKVAKGEAIHSVPGLKKWFIGQLREKKGFEGERSQRRISDEELIEKHRRDAQYLQGCTYSKDYLRVTARDTHMEIMIGNKSHPIGYKVSDAEWKQETAILEQFLVSNLKAVCP